MKTYDIPFKTHHSAEYIQKNREIIEKTIHNEIKYSIRDDLKLQIPIQIKLISFTNYKFTCELIIQKPKKSYHEDIYNNPKELLDIIKYLQFYI